MLFVNQAIRDPEVNALVTGGSRGIGRAIVLKMVREGYNCVFTYADNKEAANETLRVARKIDSNIQIEAHLMDQGYIEQVERVSNDIFESFGTIEVLVNNAAVNCNNAIAFMADEQWDKVIRTNLSGPFYLIRQFVMHMVGNRFGRIINISSLAEDGASGQAGYAASKGGLVALSKTVAREYGLKGITCNVVTVGLVETELTSDQLSERLKSVWLEYCPVGRIGEADEIADAVHYLTTEKAGFINGEIIKVTGGLTYVP